MIARLLGFALAVADGGPPPPAMPSCHWQPGASFEQAQCSICLPEEGCFPTTIDAAAVLQLKRQWEAAQIRPDGGSSSDAGPKQQDQRDGGANAAQSADRDGGRAQPQR